MAQSLSNLTVKQLQGLCKQQKLPIHGTKSKIVRRLTNSSNAVNNRHYSDEPARKRRKILSNQSKTTTKNENAEVDDDEIESEKEDDDIVDLIVHLNVGGIKYVSRLQTLLKFKESNHFFIRNIDTANTNDHPYFIDRDGKQFIHILNFLRDGESFKCNVLPNLSKDTILFVKQESKYYGLYDLMFDMLDSKIDWKPLFWQCTGNEIFVKKVFLNKDSNFKEIITQIIPEKYVVNEQTITFEIKVKNCGENENDLVFGMTNTKRIVDRIRSNEKDIACLRLPYEPNSETTETITIDFKNRTFASVNSACNGTIDSDIFNLHEDDYKCLRVAICVYSENSEFELSVD